MQISASTVLPLAAQLAFRIIIHPENEKVFRHLDHCVEHKVLETDECNGRVVVESEHVATWRLFALSGRLRTRLRVEQDHAGLVSRFQLLPGRFNLLRSFNGTWTVEEQPPGADGGERCRLTLEQELQPAIFLPPPLGSILKQVACRQLRSVFQDLRAEAARINKGCPTLWSPAQQGEALPLLEPWKGLEQQQQAQQQQQQQEAQQQTQQQQGLDRPPTPAVEEAEVHVPPPDDS